MLDFDALRQYATENIPGLIFVTVSGAHLYGFPSPDSDVDLRGTFMPPRLEQVLSLNKPKETLEPEGIVGRHRSRTGRAMRSRSICVCWSSRTATCWNKICSPIVVITSPAHEELKALSTGEA